MKLTPEQVAHTRAAIESNSLKLGHLKAWLCVHDKVFTQPDAYCSITEATRALLAGLQNECHEEKMKNCKCIFCQDISAAMDELKSEIPAGSFAKVTALVNMLGHELVDVSTKLSRLRAAQAGDSLVQKLQALAISLDEEESLTLPDVTGRARKAFNVERVTKKFYDRFKTEHAVFLKFLEGIPDEELER